MRAGKWIVNVQTANISPEANAAHVCKNPVAKLKPAATKATPKKTVQNQCHGIQPGTIPAIIVRI